jgi:hypothetical protein
MRSRLGREQIGKLFLRKSLPKMSLGWDAIANPL